MTTSLFFTSIQMFRTKTLTVWSFWNNSEMQSEHQIPDRFTFTTDVCVCVCLPLRKTEGRGLQFRPGEEKFD